MSERVKVIILGCGSRGCSYAAILKTQSERVQIVAVAEPRDYYRNKIGDENDIPQELRFRTWEDVLKRPKFADAVLICMQDHMHEEPAILSAELGYHILLEKPMAPTKEACERIVAAVRKAGVMFAVCHVLRYTVFTREIKKIIASGEIGDVVNIQRLEGVAAWHQAHSFVRGNWRNEAESSFMLLAKSCHDMDWIRYVMNKPCKSVSSFGSLYHFRKENQPKGAANRCLDCPEAIERQCPYSAKRFYLEDKFRKGLYGWPLDILTTDMTEEGVLKALREGPYGRCVYACDNDVVDNQVVNMVFDDGTTSSFTMTAFCNDGRQTRIGGTRGAIYGDEQNIVVTDFKTRTKRTIDTKILNDGGIGSGHGGGDEGIIMAFLKALETGDRSHILTGLDDTLQGHLMTFAAETARLTNTVQDV